MNKKLSLFQFFKHIEKPEYVVHMILQKYMRHSKKEN